MFNFTPFQNLYQNLAGTNNKLFECFQKIENYLSQIAAMLNSEGLTWAKLTLQNSWVFFNVAENLPSVTINSDGMLVFSGMMKHLAFPGSGSIFATLTSDFKPQKIIGMATSVQDTTLGQFFAGEITIGTDGVMRILCTVTAGHGVIVLLDGLSCRISN